MTKIIDDLCQVAREDLVKAKNESVKTNSLEETLEKEKIDLSKKGNQVSVDVYCDKLDHIKRVAEHLETEPVQDPTFKPLLLAHPIEVKKTLIKHSFKKPVGDESIVVGKFGCETTLIQIKLESETSAWLSVEKSNSTTQFLLLNCIRPGSDISEMHILKSYSPRTIDISKF